MFNTHTHSQYSPDGHGSIDDICRQAVSLGMTYLAFTDHVELGECRHHCLPDLSSYVQDIAECAARYKSKGLYVACGVEMGWYPSVEMWAKQVVDKFGFEYVINSVHEFDGVVADGKKAYYDRYLDCVIESLKCQYGCDTIGHLGFITRYGYFEDSRIGLDDFGDKLTVILDRIIGKGKILELNSSVGHGSDITVPSADILRLYKQRGGELITFAADCHKKDRLLYNFDNVKKLALELGFEYWFVKKGSELVAIRIEE